MIVKGDILPDSCPTDDFDDDSWDSSQNDEEPNDELSMRYSAKLI